MKMLVVIGIFAVLLATGGAGTADAQARSFADFATFLNKTSSLSHLRNAIAVADLMPAISDSRFVGTFFAPTNDAFEKLAKELQTDIEGLMANKTLVQFVLLYHVISGAALAAKDALILPTRITMMVGVDTAIVKRVYGSTVISLTITDVSGRVAKAITFDIKVGNSMAHIIDKVLLPVVLPPVAPANMGPVVPLLDALAAEGDLTFFREIAMGLFNTDTLRGLENMTILAPTDTAFASLLTFIKERNLALDIPSLPATMKAAVWNILTTHLVPGRQITSSNVTDGMELSTLTRGTSLMLDLKSKPGSAVVKVKQAPSNNATVVKADVLVPSKGIVIHKIDKILTNVDLSIFG